ncbi:unnamed protein product, partial [Clonostachys rosea]
YKIRLFRPIEPGLSQYPRASWEFMAGKADSFDPDAHQIVVKTIPTPVELSPTIHAKEGMPWKEVGSTEDTKNKVYTVQKQVKSSQSILIAGGGPTGIEVAGEIAFEYGQKGQKEVYFATDKKLPLDDAWQEDIRQGIKNELEKLGVKHIPNTKVTAAKPGYSSKGRTTLELTKASGKTSQLTVGAYLPAIGVEPNSDFVPAKYRNETGWVLQDKILRLPGHGDMFVIGDGGSMEAPSAIKAESHLIYSAKAIEQYVTGQTQFYQYKADATSIYLCRQPTSSKVERRRPHKSG